MDHVGRCMRTRDRLATTLIDLSEELLVESDRTRNDRSTVDIEARYWGLNIFDENACSIGQS